MNQSTNAPLAPTQILRRNHSGQFISVTGVDETGAARERGIGGDRPAPGPTSTRRASVTDTETNVIAEAVANLLWWDNSKNDT